MFGPGIYVYGFVGIKVHRIQNLFILFNTCKNVLSVILYDSYNITDHTFVLL